MGTIRVATESDGAALSRIYAPAVLDHPTSFEIVPPDAAEFAARVAKILPRFPWLVCEVNGNVIGYAYSSAHHERAAYRWSVDVATYVDRAVHRRGIGRALYTSLFRILTLQRFRNAYAGITLPNAASEGMHRAFGFTLVGVYHHVGYKLGAWHDVAWFERPIANLVTEPPEPIPFSEIRDTTEVHTALKAGGALLG